MNNLYLRSFLLSCVLISSTYASERMFTYTYQSNVLGRGQKEIELWNTFSWQREDFYRKFIHRIEYEIGLGGNLQTAFYFNVKSEAAFIQGPPGILASESELSFSNEWKLKFSDPLADAIGSAAYLEFGISPNAIELEAKIILDKQLGKATHALNIVAEPEWELKGADTGTTTESEFALEALYGFSYHIDEAWNLGLELRNHNTFAGQEGLKYSTLCAGPTVSYRSSGWWATLTLLPQLYAFKTQQGNSHPHLELLGQERFETRLLFAYEF